VAQPAVRDEGRFFFGRKGEEVGEAKQIGDRTHGPYVGEREHCPRGEVRSNEAHHYDRVGSVGYDGDGG